MTSDDRLDEILDAAARQALSEGVTAGDAYGGPVHLWVRRNVRYRPETEFFVVFLISFRIADLAAQAEGYEGAVHRAVDLAKKSLARKRERAERAA
jgi:hypothetical protein